MEDVEDWRVLVKEAELYYKLSEEIKNVHPLIAYYMNLHGLEKVHKNLMSLSPDKKYKSIKAKVSKYLGTKTSLLEEIKPTLDISKKTEAIEIFEEYVFSSLAKVDKMEKDPSAKIDMQTAKNFMTVAILIETMETLHCLSDEWQERKKYCLFKAGHITKSINEGKVPKRGNPFTDKDLDKKEHPLVPKAEDEVPDEGDMTAKHVRTNIAFSSKPNKEESEDEEENNK